MAKAAKREHAAPDIKRWSVKTSEPRPKSPEKKLRVVKEAPAPVEFPPMEEKKMLSKKDIKEMVAERQKLDDKVKELDVRSKIHGKLSKADATKREAFVSRVMEINADLEANDVVVPRQVEMEGRATESRVPLNDTDEEATMAGEPLAFEHPEPVEFTKTVAETLKERKQKEKTFTEKEMSAHLAKTREIMKRIHKERIMARITKEHEARKHEKMAAEVKRLAHRDIKQVERNAAKAEHRQKEAKAEQLRKATLQETEMRDEQKEEIVAKDMDVSVAELRNIEHAFADIQAARVKAGDEKLDFTWEDFLNAPMEPEPPKGFGDRVARLFRKPSTKREAMWKKILDAVNELGRGQTSLKTRARHQTRPTKK